MTFVRVNTLYGDWNTTNLLNIHVEKVVLHYEHEKIIYMHLIDSECPILGQISAYCRCLQSLASACNIVLL